MVSFQIEPLTSWDRPMTEVRKGSHTFKAKWEDTLDLLKHEVDALGGRLVVVQLDVIRGDIRRDGMLRAGGQPGSAKVKVSFESHHGPLTYATDVYFREHSWAMPGWQANVRAIALGLQALRAVDRYGITRSGEQYRGFAALGSAPAVKDSLSVHDAFQVFRQTAGIKVTEDDLKSRSGVEATYRSAARRHHPDRGGSDTVFATISRARDVLLAAAER